ncbi:hypothetical protein AB9Q04_04815 [Anaerococcus sp. ENR1011]|uniref:SCP domain-containing protein n=1 Tax=Anaerococcus groningensis TaxID=3115616 RepID=A0ABW9N158_9FIRM
MKKQLKALTLALALLTTTGCGSNQAQVSNDTKIAQAQTTEAREVKVANISTPKADAVEIEKEDNRNYLIPQTVELKEENKKEEVKEEAIVAEETTTTKEAEVANEEVKEVASNEVELENIDAVSETSESLSLPKTLEENVAAPQEAVVEENTLVETNEVTNGLTIASPSVEEVKAYWLNYESKAADQKDFYGLNLINPESEEAFVSTPNADLNSLNLGEVSNAAQEDALHIANTARFASGVKNELALGNEQTQFA